MKKLNWTRCTIQDVQDRIRREVAKRKDALREHWQTHVDRMIDDPGYARAIRDLLETLALLVRPGVVTKYVTDEIFKAYLAILRLTRPPSHHAAAGFLWG